MIGPMTRQTYTISQLAAEFEITPRALRFYEDRGLVSPGRAGQNRVYSEADRARVAIILRGKSVGFTLEEIKELLDLERLAGLKPQMQEALRRLEDRIVDLKQRRKDIDAAIKELQAGCEWLETRLADREPPEELKRSARAFEALARARLEADLATMGSE